MRQSCAVDFVGLDIRDLAFDRFGTERSKPDRGLVGRVHVSLLLPQAHREHLAFLRVAEEQPAAVAALHPEGRDEVLFDRTLPLMQALRAYFVLAYPREHVTTAFLIDHTGSAIMSQSMPFFDEEGEPDQYFAICNDITRYKDTV